MNAITKIAARLTKDEQRRQALQFTGLGAASGPVVGAVGNLIQHGKLRPPTGVPLRRWLPAAMATGALISGAIPVVRHALERRTQEGARERRAALKTKTSADKILEKLEMTRGKSKDAAAPGGFNTTGRDNRTPFVGNTQYPNEGSKGYAQTLLGQSQSKTESGPMPSFGQLSKENLSTDIDQSVKQLSFAGSLPKIGADMKFTQQLLNDPLMQFFASETGQPELLKHAEALEDNAANMPKQKEDFERVSENPDPSKDSVERSNQHTDELLKNLFDNYPAEQTVIS